MHAPDGRATIAARPDSGSRGNWIQTFSGRAFYPCDPRAEDVDIADIAHALSLQCRFAGHTLRFYSVAEHSWHVSRRVGMLKYTALGEVEHEAVRKLSMAALLHDAAEAYVTDIPRPLKHSPGMAAFRQYEARVADAIGEAFDIDPALFEHEVVKLADAELLHTERRDLMREMSPGLTPMSSMPWGMGLPGAALDELDLREPMSPGMAAIRYLARYAELLRG